MSLKMQEKLSSNYTDGKIRQDQKLAEIMLEKQAARNNKKLPWKFWNLREYRPYFMNQQRFASALLKRYSFEAILEAIKDNRCKYILSLSNKTIDPVLEEKQRIIDEKNKILELEKKDKENEKEKDKEKEENVNLNKFRNEKKKDVFDILGE